MTLFLTRKPTTGTSQKNFFMTPFFTLFVFSRASDNTTSENIGGTDAWAVPHLKFLGGPFPQFPLGLRPCVQGTMENIYYSYHAWAQKL